MYRQANSWKPAVAAGAGIYFASLIGSAFLHPYVRCRACKGSGRHRGGVFNYAWRPCHVCNGAGRKQRLTAEGLGRGQQTTSGSRIVRPTRSFGSRR
jgi:DnaJ-class molecular chaperone